MRIKEAVLGFNNPVDQKKKGITLTAKGDLRATATDIKADIDGDRTPGQRAQARAELLLRVARERPDLKRYLDNGGRVVITSGGLLNPSSWLALYREGIAVADPDDRFELHEKRPLGHGPGGQNEYYKVPVPVIKRPEELAAMVGKNKAVTSFADLSPKRLLKRAARRLDYRTLKTTSA